MGWTDPLLVSFALSAIFTALLLLFISEIINVICWIIRLVLASYLLIFVATLFLINSFYRVKPACMNCFCFPDTKVAVVTLQQIELFCV